MGDGRMRVGESQSRRRPACCELGSPKRRGLCRNRPLRRQPQPLAGLSRRRNVTTAGVEERKTLQEIDGQVVDEYLGHASSS